MATATNRIVDGVLVPLTPAEAAAVEAEWTANDAAQELRHQEQRAKKAKKDALLNQPNKSVTVQDLIDLGLL